MQQLRKSSFILGILFVVVFSNLFATFQPAYAASSAEVIDGTRIIYDGQTWTDKNPYDDTHEWQNQKDCKSTLKKQGDTLYLEYSEGTKTDDCQRQESNDVKNISVNSADRLSVLGWRISDTEIFLPIGFKDAGCAGPGQNRSAGVSGNKATFQKTTKDDENYAANRYFQLDSSGELEKRIDMTVSDGVGKVNVDSECKQGPYTQTKTESYAGIQISDLDETARKAYKLSTDGSSADSDSTENFSAGDAPTCEGGTLDFMVCPIVNGIANLADTIVRQFLQPVLRVQLLELPGSGDSTNEAIYGAWKGFRNIANIVLIFGLLAMIVATAFSSE